MLRLLVFFCDFFFRDYAVTCFGQAVVQYVKGGVGNDSKRRKTIECFSCLQGQVEHGEILEVIEQFIKQLKNSEYGQYVARERVMDGIKGWKRKIKRREREGKMCCSGHYFKSSYK